MKSLIQIILFILIATSLSSAESVRKAYIELTVNGQTLQDGDDFFVQKGDELVIMAQIRGGRRDYVQFPGTYANLDNNAEIITRNLNNLVYKLNNSLYEWKLVDENVKFESDNNVLIKMIPSERQNIHRAIANISTRKLKTTYLKVKITANWAYSVDDKVIDEETDEGLFSVNLIIKENADEWYRSANIRATGKPDTLVEAKLDEIQDYYKIIERKLVAKDFSGAQAEMRQLETRILETSAVIDKIKEQKPNYYAGITFIGLPSDNPIHDGKIFMDIQEKWTHFHALLQTQEIAFSAVEDHSDENQKRELSKIIDAFDSWWHNMSPEDLHVLQKYIPEENWEESFDINYYLSFNPEKEKVTNVEQTKMELRQFFEDRKINYKTENQKISATLLRLQATRLLDGMLMSYFTAIGFANWESTRE